MSHDKKLTNYQIIQVHFGVSWLPLLNQIQWAVNWQKLAYLSFINVHNKFPEFSGELLNSPPDYFSQTDTLQKLPNLKGNVYTYMEITKFLKEPPILLLATWKFSEQHVKTS